MTVDYFLRRLGIFALIIFAVATLNFAIPRLQPVNPIEERMNQLLQQAGSVHIASVEETIASYEERFGSNNRIWVQYANYWISLSKLDFGKSFVYFPSDVTSEVMRSMPWTLGLMGVTTVIAALIGSLFGAWLGWMRTPKASSFVVPIMLIVTAVPFYLLGLLMLWVFTVLWPVMPSGGAYDPLIAPMFDLTSAIDIIEHAILPAAAIILSSISILGLRMRGLMERTTSDYFINLAELKGLAERRIFFRYAFRNALLPQVKRLSTNLGIIVSGSLLVEVLFAYPGIGNLLYTAISGNDYLLMQGALMYVIFAVGLMLFVVDMLYPLIDPRIRYRSA